MRLLSGAVLAACAASVDGYLTGTGVAAGAFDNLIPFAVNQEVDMKVNGDMLSGIPEEYVSGRINVRVKSMDGVKFEIISHPKYGRVGWNNSVSGEFTYSPREYTLETTNHGREADRANQIPGCEDKCKGGATGDCPNDDPTKGPIASEKQKKMVLDEEVGFPCTEHWAPVDLDYFRFRAVNEYGTSNWGEVTIVFERVDSASGMLQVVLLIGGGMMLATGLGMARVVCLQAILNPNHSYPMCSKICGGFCAPPAEKGEEGHSADDVKHDMYGDDDDEDITANPLNEDDKDGEAQE